MADDIDFEEQLRQERLAAERESSKREHVDPTDGTVYEWDPVRSAWFPKIDDDFIARYQMSYGSDQASSSAPAGPISPAPSDINSEEYYHWYYRHYGNYTTPDSAKQPDNTDTTTQPMDHSADQAGGTALESRQTADANPPSGATQDPSDRLDTVQTNDADPNKTADSTSTAGKTQKTKHKLSEPPSWFEISENKNTNVYVSGLPEEITDDEFKELMNKCGLIMYDPITRKPKLKLYKDEAGKNKGDGRCCYIKPESVDLALQFLDGSYLKGCVIHVERAKFEMKGNFDPNKRRRKLTKQEKKKFKEKQEKLLDWRPDKPLGTRNRNEKVVVLKNVFDIKIFESDPTIVNAVRDKLLKECSIFGEVKKVAVYDRHPDGVAMVTFKEFEGADVCIDGMNGRYYNQRLVKAAVWDGHTKYVIQETEQQFEQRLNQWTAYLEGETNTGAPTPADTSTPTPADTPTPSDTGTSSTIDTGTPTPADTPTTTDTPTPTDTSTPTTTDTGTPTPADTPTTTDTPTPADTGTPTTTDTPTPTDTGTPTVTDTPTPTDTGTPTVTDTDTPTCTDNGTPTPTDTQTQGGQV